MNNKLDIIFRVRRSLSKNELIPIKEIITEKNINIEEYKNICNLLNDNELDIESLYYVKDSIPNFFYIDVKRLIFVDIWAFTIEYFEKFNTIKFMKQQEIFHKKFLEEKKFDTLCTRIDAKYALIFMEDFIKNLPIDLAYELFKSTYIKMDFSSNDLDMNWVNTLLDYKKTKKYKFKRFKKYEKDEYIIVYRGHDDYYGDLNNKFSWSLSYDIAEWYKNRMDGLGTIYQAKIKKDKIIDYIPSREEEIWVKYEDLENIEEII